MKPCRQLQQLDVSVQSLRRRIFAALFWCQFKRIGAIAGFAVGALLPLLIWSGATASPVRWGATGGALLVAAAGAAVAAARRTPDRRRIVALLDSRCNSATAGLLVAGTEIALGEWQEKITLPAPPRLRLQTGRSDVVLFCALAFAVAAALLPVEAFDPTRTPQLDIRNEITQAEAALTLLSEEKLLAPELKNALSEELENLNRDASGAALAQTLEALDHLQNQLDNRLTDACARTGAALDKLHTFAKLAAQARAAATPEAQGAVAAELNTLLKRLADEDPTLAAALQKYGDSRTPGTATEAGQLAAEALEELLKKLESVSQCHNTSPPSCRTASAGDAATAAAAEAAIAAMLARYDAEAALEKLQDALYGSQPGSGAVARGRGDAPLTFAPRALDPEQARYQDMPLPGAQPDLKNTQLLGVSAAAPQPDGATQPPEPGRFQNTAVGTRRHQRRGMEPQHRSAIADYFKSINQNSK